MQVLHQIIHGDLGRVRRREVDKLDIVKELVIGLVFSINMAAFSQQNCKEVGANLSMLDLLKFLRFDLLEEFDNCAIVLAEDSVLGRDVVWKQLSEE